MVTHQQGAHNSHPHRKCLMEVVNVNLKQNYNYAMHNCIFLQFNTSSGFNILT